MTPEPQNKEDAAIERYLRFSFAAIYTVAIGAMTVLTMNAVKGRAR